MIRIARELSDALAYAQERGVVHRDLKPENVLLTRGHALVADFGVAKAVSASVKSGAGSSISGLTSVGLALGTPAYMAPEQASADPATDHRADLYALGCVLYELLAGTPPFFGRPTQSLLAAHIAEAPEPIARRRPATPPLLAALIMRMLEKRPADRPQSADEVLRSLEVASTLITITDGQVVAGAPATTGQTTPASVTGDLTVSSRMPSKTGWRIGLLGGLIAGVVLVGVVVTAGGGRRAADSKTANAHAIAIQPFENRGGSPELTAAAGAAAEYLTDAVSSVEGALIVRGTPAEARYTITGSIEPAGGDSAVLRVRLFDQKSGTALRILTPARISVAEPVGALEPLRSRVQGAISMVLHPMLGPGTLPRVDAPTPAAFADFAIGMEQVERTSAGLVADFKRRDYHMARAASLDSTFLLPVILAAIFSGNARLADLPAADASLDSILRVSGERLTPFERALGEWWRAAVRGDRAGALRLAARLHAAAPEVKWNILRYAAALMDVGRYEAALPLLDSLSLTATGDFPSLWGRYT